MKSISFFAITLAICLAAGISRAEDKPAKPAAKKPGKPGANLDGDAKKKIIAKFDKDGDGKLNDTERAVAEEAMKKRLGGDRPEGVDKKALLKKFDKDGDGKLSDEEKRAAKKAMQSGGGKPGKKTDEKEPADEGKGSAIPAEVLKKFDKDGDGKLNEEEKKAAYEALKKRKAEQDK